MFAEELKGNANRKRQDQARERRRKAKEQQKKQQEEEDKKCRSVNASNSTSTSMSTSNNMSSNPTIMVKNTTTSKTEELMIATKGTGSTSSSDAVSKALEQRKIRSLQKKHHCAALVIQAAYRSYNCVVKLRQLHRTVLENRISDLITLREVLKKQQTGEQIIEYIAPTNLASALVNQLLFLTYSTPRLQKVKYDGSKDHPSSTTDDIELKYFSKIQQLTTSHMKLLVKILDIVILPGIIGNDVHLDPSVVWLESKEGEFKFKKLLRLVCHSFQARLLCDGGTYMNNNVPFLAGGDDIRVIEKFIRVLIGIDSLKPRNKKLISFCNDQFFEQNIDYSVLRPGGCTIGQGTLGAESLDLIHILRSFMLYPCQKEAKVIPPHAEEARENCIMKHERERADVLFRLVLDGLYSQNTKLKSRFFAEVMSIPLLTWRIESTSLSHFVQFDTTIGTASFLHFLEIFTNYFSQEIASGLLGNSSGTSILPTHDVPLNLCPAPSVLCLFSNLIQLGFMCSMVYGNKQSIDFEASALYFKFLATLIDLVPLGTFSSRQSSVEWLEVGTQLTPIVLSPVIIDQCKLVLVDSHVRALFQCAIDKDAMNIDKIIKCKDIADEKLERDLEEIMKESLASVAAKEAMVDRSKGILNSSWAKQLSIKLKSVFSSNEKDKEPKVGRGTLLNTSDMSRNLAAGTITSNPTKALQNEGDVNRANNFNTQLFFSLSYFYSIFLSRWGGAGGEDIVNRKSIVSSNESKHVVATSKPEQCVISFLNVLCFATLYVQAGWALIQSNTIISDNLKHMVDVNRRTQPIRSICLEPNKHSGSDGEAILLMFVVSLSHGLIVTDDVELHDMDSPLPLHQIRRCIVLLKKLLYRSCCLDDTKSSKTEGFQTNHFGLSLIASSSKLMRDLHDRSSRRVICHPKLWLVEDLLEEEIKRSKLYEDFCAIINSPVLRVCPFLVSFKRRLQLFEKLISTNREKIQGRNDGFSPRPGITVNITRGRVLEDGILTLNKLGPRLRQRIIVRYRNQAGVEEKGLDAGGLFKEFWTDLSDLSFNLNYGLFSETEDGGMLYPNKGARAAHGSESIILYEFLGRIIGKALYEGITIKPQFAHFFLSFIRGDYNFLHMLPDLATMDHMLYDNLRFLKTYEGNCEDLCLNFTVTNDDFGTNKAIELIPNGSTVDVTDFNKHLYIGLVAKHHVCDSVKEQSQAFTRGLWDVIDKAWLRIFNEPELQVLISGSTDGKLDVADMKANAKYTGGYTVFDRHIGRFWRVVSSLNRKQQSDLLRFVTSCERPPPLGFGSLSPPFTIQRVTIMMDSDKLPTASTCFNILKLPTYSSEKIMKERLIYAIESGSGFELT